ncbi:MAG: BPTI/Kunitz domain-containing protein [Pseudomonadota bacterium]
MRHFSTVLALSALLPLLSACSSAPELPEACSAKPESGRCRAAFTRYWFDEGAGTCRAFIWGGCGGSVPFETLETCHAQCMPGLPVPEDGGPRQVMPPPPASTAP